MFAEANNRSGGLRTLVASGPTLCPQRKEKRVSAKQVEDKKRSGWLHKDPDGVILVAWPWTARQKRAKAGNRKSRKQARKALRNRK